LLRVLLRRGSRRIHVLTGVYLSGLTFTVTAIAVTDATRFHFVPDPRVSLATIGLVAGIAFAVVARLERGWVLTAMVPLGILATLASALYSASITSGQGGCAYTYVNKGFPLAWSSTYDLLGSPCYLLLYLIYNPARDLIFYSLDVIFYVAVGLAIIQVYRGIVGKTVTAQ
jgi:hypothetical protein